MAYEQNTAKKDTDGNASITLGTGLNKIDDSVTSYPSSCTATTVDLATDADVVVTISAALLLGVYCSTATSAHAVLIKDSVGTKLTLGAAGTPIGTNIPCYGTLMDNITVESDNSATGTLTIFWRAA